jgi:hypothetical protein
MSLLQKIAVIKKTLIFELLERLGVLQKTQNLKRPHRTSDRPAPSSSFILPCPSPVSKKADKLVK